MNLKLFLSPVSELLLEKDHDPKSVGYAMYLNAEELPDWKGTDMALISVPDPRGSTDTYGITEAGRHIREKLYALRKGSGKFRITDLGQLNPAETLDETYLRLKEVCETLMVNNVLPIIIGASHDFDYGQYQAYEGLDKLISVLNIDAFLDMEDTPNHLACQKHVQQILFHEPNYLFHFNQLAYQSYLADHDLLQVLERLYFKAVRLGRLRENFKETEPLIRDADMISFDIAAIRSSDAPGTLFPQPFGLTGEEACQMCWYAGMNEKLTSIGFYGYHPGRDDAYHKTAQVIATMIWYFVEGFYNRKDDISFRTKDYLKYVVSLPQDPGTMVFYKSTISGKWWLEVALPNQGQIFFQRKVTVPCSYTDYELASNGEIPARWVEAQAKFN